jgi:hypothetical protein
LDIKEKEQNPDPSKNGKGRAPAKATAVTPRRLAIVVSFTRECSSREKTRKGLPPAKAAAKVITDVFTPDASQADKIDVNGITVPAPQSDAWWNQLNAP